MELVKVLVVNGGSGGGEDLQIINQVEELVIHLQQVHHKVIHGGILVHLAGGCWRWWWCYKEEGGVQVQDQVEMVEHWW